MSPLYLNIRSDTRYLCLLIRFNVLLPSPPGFSTAPVFRRKRMQRYNHFQNRQNIFFVKFVSSTASRCKCGGYALKNFSRLPFRGESGARKTARKGRLRGVFAPFPAPLWQNQRNAFSSSMLDIKNNPENGTTRGQVNSNFGQGKIGKNLQNIYFLFNFATCKL